MNDNQQFVSVILPVHNRASVLLDSVRSVLQQAYKNLELIIVDDASTEDVSSMVAELGDPRVKMLRLEENQGPSYARNVGIKAARADIIAFQDSDDIWRSDKLMRQMEVLDDSTDAVFCSYEMESPKDRVIRFPPGLSAEISSDEISVKLNERSLVGTPTMLIRRDVFDKVGGFDEGLRGLEDWDLAIRISRVAVIKYIEEPLVIASYSGTGVNHNSVRVVQSAMGMLQKYRACERLSKSLIWVALMNLANIEADIDKDFYLREISSLIDDSSSFINIASDYMSMAVELRKMNQIISLLCSDKCIERIISEYGLCDRPVAIYGLGLIGMACVDRLLSRGIDVRELIDANVVSYRGVEVKKIENIKPTESLLVIVSIINKALSVINNASRFLEAEYVLIEDIVCPDGCTGVTI